MRYRGVGSKRVLGRFDTLVLSLTMVLTASVGRAQDVSGSVRDAATSEPVRGAVVILLGPNREYLARGITSSSGTFRLNRDHATTIRVMRIGYSPHEQRITSDGRISVSLTPLGRSLRPVAVNTGSVCPQRQDQREALSLWASATDAMLAMVIASADTTAGGAVAQILYDRNMGVEGRRVVRQSVHRVVTGNAAPIRADRTPEEFVESGYVIHRGNVTTYYAPDPEVLLDSSFAATHCLSIRTDRTRPGEVGVAFTTPRDRDTIPDITGVLWLTRSPMALKTLTFEYRGIDRVVMDMRAGGLLEFETMSNGVPVIRSWYVRSPKLRHFPVGSVVHGRIVRTGSTADVMSVHETGGLIAEGRLADGTLLVAPLSTLGGRVLNTVDGGAVRGARLTLDSTDYVAMTDGEGQFSFEGVLPGPYTLRVRDSVVITTMRVDSAGIVVPDTSVQQVVTRIATRPVEARLGHVSPVDVRLPWKAPVSGCGPLPQGERRFTLLAGVQTPDSTPIPNARVRLTWADTTRTSTLETLVDAVTSAEGSFAMCGIPSETPLATRVVSGDGTVYEGWARVNHVDVDERTGRPRNSNLRFIRIVVAPVVPSR